VTRNIAILLVLSGAVLAGCTGTGSQAKHSPGAAAERELILVAGASGRVGRYVIEGDVRDAARMREVMAGVTAVISVVGSREISGPNSAEFVDYGGVVNMVEAAKLEGVKHFVLLTAIGVTDPEHPFNKATKGSLQWRYQGEEHLRDSGVA
jgi:uncharacterized protein YbjT (DUF2867 family)